MGKPTLEQIKAHFKKATSIKCLKFKSAIDVTYVKEYIYDEKSNSYQSKGNQVTFWKDGVYAEILKKNCKCADCNNCK